MGSEKIGKFVLSARLQAGLTLVGFEKRFGIPNQTLYQIECGALPHMATFKKLLHAMIQLGQDGDEFYRLYEQAYSVRREKMRANFEHNKQKGKNKRRKRK